MKDKILVFIIGCLVGAVITASGFLISNKINKDINKNSTTMPSNGQMTMMGMPNGQGQTPPEKPSGSDNNTNRPEIPGNNNSQANT